MIIDLDCVRGCMDFGYILDKVRAAEISDSPFPHIEITDLFSREDFDNIIAAPEIRLPPQSSDEQLFEAMFAVGYEIIKFPGCVDDRDQYLKWHRTRVDDAGVIHSACEGFGMTLRLAKARSLPVDRLLTLLKSEAFQSTLAAKFDLPRSALRYDAGVQKYLDGYEISPHPDIRSKALTFMVNINPAPRSETVDHHTHYLRFREPYRYVQSFWTANTAVDRCWVPWSWCETVAQQRLNNSLVMFSPSDETLHAVRAKYDHLHYQRTQIYGNFWYEKTPKPASKPRWEELAIA